MVQQTIRNAEALRKRNDLVLQHMSLIYYVLRQLKVALPVGMSKEDLVQYGCIGLIEALDSFDGRIGSVSNFACIRIKGAMLDGIIQYQWLSRSQRRKGQKWSETKSYLEMIRGESVTSEEVHSFLNLDSQEGEVWRRMADVSVIYEEESEGWETLPLKETEYAGDWQEKKEERGDLQQALKRLSPEERNLIRDHYFRQKPLTVFARENRISSSWAYRIHRRALNKLKKWMEE